MSLLLVVLVVALALGRTLGGSLERLGALRLRRGRLLLLAVGVQLAGALLAGALLAGPEPGWAFAYPVGLAVSAAMAAGFLLANRRLAGIGLVALGLASNALVVGLNGAMPVSAAAAERLGVDLRAIAGPDDLRHEPLSDQTRLAPLSDVVPVALPVRPEVVSVGDVLLAAGVGRLVLLGMLAGPGRAVRSAHRPVCQS